MMPINGYRAEFVQLVRKFSHLTSIMENNAIFDEKYRVIAIDEQNLILQGIRSGEVLTIKNAHPENPLTAEDYPPGRLIALNDPSTDTNS